jgi:thiamine-phosphate pyrophosphorylase
MKLIVISAPAEIQHEASVVNALFDEGLELLHLRKPAYSEDMLSDLVSKIDRVHRAKLVLHQHHPVADRLGICRIHFPEVNRLTATPGQLATWKKNNFKLSTSVHDMKEYESLSACFEYAFFGPVFQSISKQGYRPLQESQRVEKKNESVKIIAIGGICGDNIAMVKQANYDGAAMLGAIWSNPANAIKAFKHVSRA